MAHRLQLQFDLERRNKLDRRKRAVAACSLLFMQYAALQCAYELEPDALMAMQLHQQLNGATAQQLHQSGSRPVKKPALNGTEEAWSDSSDDECSGLPVDWSTCEQVILSRTHSRTLSFTLVPSSTRVALLVHYVSALQNSTSDSRQSAGGN